MGNRDYVWDALGRLVEVREEGKPLAAYAYSHRGERIGKTAQGQGTSYLYEDGQVSAELNANGQITRLYLYLDGQIIAVIDTPQGKLLSKEELSAPALLGLDAQNILKRLWQSIAGNDAAEQTAWLHVNHLGAPEAATDSSGQLIWQASYEPFGAARIIKASAKANGENRGAENFSLNLRLPGQYADAETGLFYNRHRYYDPARGEYLTPDPLGTPDGPNGYAYVRYNPLKYVDPEGLILFAFDGTGNTEASKTNVYWLGKAYNDNDVTKKADGSLEFAATAANPFYIEGPGTGQIGDSALAYSMRGRINTQLGRLDQYVKAKWDNEINEQKNTFSKDAPLVITLDIMGFSRGAAAARDFANQVIDRKNRNYYSKDLFGYAANDGRYNCVGIKIRFMGLFDSVLSTAVGDFNTAISSSQIEYVAQAVAVNEQRVMFPLLSIDDSAGGAGFTANRMEKGFIGAHSDIGGGYAGTGGDGGDLSDVALNWMFEQAKTATGGKMKALEPDQLKITNPILHDETRVAPWNLPGFGGLSRDRTITYLDQSSANMKVAQTEGMTYAQSQQGQTDIQAKYINYYNFYAGNKAGLVDMDKYKQWLKNNLGLSLP